MKRIKVTFRAVLSGPKGILNPMGLKVGGSQDIEVFGQGEKWQAREIATAKRNVFVRIGVWPSPSTAQNAVERCFDSVVEPWQAWGRFPEEPAEKLLLPEDFSHILHAPDVKPGKKYPPAACGVEVPVKSYINNRANVEPTCKACAEVWRKEYKGK